MKKLICVLLLLCAFSAEAIEEIIDYIPDGWEICDVPFESVHERIGNRDYPSVFSAWGKIEHPTVLNLPDNSGLEKMALHDLHFHGLIFDLNYLRTEEGMWVLGEKEYSSQSYETYRNANPDTIFLAAILMREAHIDDTPDLPYWIRDESRNLILSDEAGEFALTDFTHPGMQNQIIQQAIAVAKCGRYDGIFFDWWYEDFPILFDDTNYGVGFRGLQAEQDARDNILAGIRSEVRDDFLILVNGARKKFPRTAWAINGIFMETLTDEGYLDLDVIGYTHQGIEQIEHTLRWAEENLREPRINCLEGFSIRTQAPDSPINLKWMRVFTTMSLTHSDGYVLQNDGYTHEHYWYDFWDANLGRPLTETSQHYNNIDGIFIREYTNGWAVFNRSGVAQTIRLPEQTTGVSSQLSATEHRLADLDGEMYLKRRSDLNADGSVNILDLVLVAGALGTANPSYDLNSDGSVNILDLVIVANDFGE